MKKLERIFLYTVLAILVFYVFLVDGNVESQEYKLGQYITARSINIVDDEGQLCIALFAGENGGNISIVNKDFKFVVNMGVTEDGGGAINITNREGISVVDIADHEDGGAMIFYSKTGVNLVGIETTDEGGMIMTFNKDGVIGTLMVSNEEGGEVRTYNKNDQELVSISQTEEGHGGIWIYDRYGEFPAFYGHKR